jgi:rhodanese-related sulfurtransferase
MRARRAAQALRGAGVDAVVLRGGMDGFNRRRQPA